MLLNYTLGLVLFVPLIFTPIVYLLGKYTGKNTGWFTAVPLVVTLMLLVTVAAEIRGGGAYQEIYEWAPEAGLSFGLRADGLSIWVLLTINILCLGISLYQ